MYERELNCGKGVFRQVLDLHGELVQRGVIRAIENTPDWGLGKITLGSLYFSTTLISPAYNSMSPASGFWDLFNTSTSKVDLGIGPSSGPPLPPRTSWALGNGRAALPTSFLTPSHTTFHMAICSPGRPASRGGTTATIWMSVDSSPLVFNGCATGLTCARVPIGFTT